MAPKSSSTLAQWIKRALRDEPPRSKSLIITIFGDMLVPHVPDVWLRELIELLHPFHVNERLVRTSAFRLAEEGWLESTRAGRLSRYALSVSGLARVRHAYHRIYDPPKQAWNGEWTVILPTRRGSHIAGRSALRRELEWEGYGSLAPGLFLHPAPQLATLRDILGRLKLTHSVSVLTARDLEAFTPSPALAAECWNLSDVAAQYAGFISRFDPLLPLLTRELDPQIAFVIQTLLIHHFRRVVLDDPRLPAVLLPDDWPGHAAYQLCRSIYLRTFRKARLHLAHTLGKASASALKPTDDFRRRLGGLER